MADDLGTNLDQLLPQAGQRPVLDRLGCRQGAQEVAEIVGQGVKLEADGIGGEGPTGKSRPFDRSLAFFDPLLAGAALVVEGDDMLLAAAAAMPRSSFAASPDGFCNAMAMTVMTG